MESAAVLRSFSCSVGNVPQAQSIFKRPCMVAVHNVSWPTSSKSHVQACAFGGKLVSYPTKREEMVVSCAKTSATTVATKSDVSSESGLQGLQENPLPRATFPSGFEALVLEVCDETEIAELKIKVGDFEMHLKRNIGATESAMTDVSPAIPPPVSSSPMIEAAPASPPPPPPPPPSKSSPFIHVSPVKTSKLAALEASGASGYLIVSSPAVGSFLRSRTWKGKKQPPICKEGAMIKEGKVLAYVDQVGSQVSVIANVDGEVLKVLFEEGEAVAYGDPLFAVLPSFHDIVE